MKALHKIPNQQVDTILDKKLITALEKGLPICTKPYHYIAKQVGITPEEVLKRIEELQQQALIKRFGVVVRHKELGYHANGMVVWDIPDEQVRKLGQCISQYSFVTLCYRRPRRLPLWRYNLFTMVHGHNREEVEKSVAEIVEQCDLQHIPHKILFSTRRFKQRGASYGLHKALTPKLQLVK